MKIRIPKKIRISKSTIKDYVLLFLFIVGISATFFGIVYGIRYVKYKAYAEAKEKECQQFTIFLNKEVLPKTNGTVRDCECHYKNIDVGKFNVNCLCSCKLYDENGTLIDDDWNPVFTSI